MARKPALVIVYSSKSWTLAWPRDQWEALTPAQQQDVLEGQKKLCERMRLARVRAESKV